MVSGKPYRSPEKGRQSRAARCPRAGKTATDQLAAEFDAADQNLNEESDSLMPQFRSANATFITDYTNARIIVDGAAGRRTGLRRATARAGQGSLR